jgi:hypothetical protein
MPGPTPGHDGEMVPPFVMRGLGPRIHVFKWITRP